MTLTSPLLDVEFEFDYTRVFVHGQPDTVPGAHVRYRKPGTRFWTKFLIVGEPDETLQSIDAKVEPAVLAHSEGRVS